MGWNHTQTIETFGILVMMHKILAARCIQSDFGYRDFCTLPSPAPSQLCFCLHPAALNGGHQGLTGLLVEEVWDFSGLSSCLFVLLYTSRDSPLELCFNSSGFLNMILVCTRDTLKPALHLSIKQSEQWSGILSDSFSSNKLRLAPDSLAMRSRCGQYFFYFLGK